MVNARCAGGKASSPTHTVWCSRGVAESCSAPPSPARFSDPQTTWKPVRKNLFQIKAWCHPLLSYPELICVRKVRFRPDNTPLQMLKVWMKKTAAPQAVAKRNDDNMTVLSHNVHTVIQKFNLCAVNARLTNISWIKSLEWQVWWPSLAPSYYWTGSIIFIISFYRKYTKSIPGYVALAPSF